MEARSHAVQTEGTQNTAGYPRTAGKTSALWFGEDTKIIGGIKESLGDCVRET